MAMELFVEVAGTKVPWGLAKYLATKYGVHRTTVYRICAKAKNQRAEGKDVIVNHENYKCGRKPLISNDEDGVLLSVTLKQRTTL